MPRNALKHLIQYELEKQAPILFNKLMVDNGIVQGPDNLPELEESKKSPEVTCDGCQNQISAIRYQCSVCENFNFCESCEEQMEHPHSFLKIRQPAQSAMLQSQKIEEPKQMKKCRGEQMEQSWKQIIGKFANKVNDQIQKPQDNQWAIGGQNQKNRQRALLISRPTQVLEGKPGSILMPTIEIKNSTHWSWKKDVFLGIDDQTDFTKMFIELIQQPIDFEVKGQETFKLTVPIQITAQAQVSPKIHDLALVFRGPNGNSFGDLIPIQFKIVDDSGQQQPVQQVSEVQLTKLAIKLYDMKVGKSYEECLEVVTQVNGDKEKALQILTQK